MPTVSGKVDDGNVVGNGKPAGNGGSPDAVGARLVAGRPIVIDPANIGNASVGGGAGTDNAGSGDRPRRKYTKRGTGSAVGKETPLSVDGVSAILVSVHTILAAFIKVPELALDPREADEMAKAAANVARHYDVSASVKTLDWVNLATTCATVYGTRIYAARLRMKEEKTKATPGGLGERVVPFPG